MTIELTDEQLAVLQVEADSRNTDPKAEVKHTPETVAQHLVDEAVESYAATQRSAQLENLKELGAAFLAAKPETQAQVIKMLS